MLTLLYGVPYTLSSIIYEKAQTNVKSWGKNQASQE